MSRPITEVELQMLEAILRFDAAPRKLSDPEYLRAEAAVFLALAQLKAERGVPRPDPGMAMLKQEPEWPEGV